MNKRTICKYLITIMAGGLFVWYYLQSRNYSSLNKINQFRVLADAFTIPGLLYSCIGLLLVISNTGVLDGVLYGLATAVRMLTPGAKKRQRYDEFLYDRKEKKIKGLGFLLISGLLFLAIALFYMSKFYKIYQR